MLEKWKDIKGYEGLYQVSNLGRVKSLITNKILKNRKTIQNYLSVVLYKNGVSKNCRVHRLVAQTFIPNPDNLPQVNHKDFNRQNNNINNLEWCSAKYNIQYTFEYGNIEKILENAKKLEKCMVEISKQQPILKKHYQNK